MTHCLFVDDSAVIRKVARRILADVGVKVTEAASGLEAIEICLEDMPDIIVIDETLQDVTSADVIRRIRAIPGPAKPHILVCLTEIDVAAIMRAKRAGAMGYLLKPFERTQLLESFGALAVAA